MQRLWLFLIIAPVFLAGAAWAGGAASPPALTEKDAGKRLSLKVGDRLLLDLRNPASGGYTNLEPLYDVQILKLVARREVPPESGPVPRMGDFGRIRLEFEAMAPGATEIIVQISRPWEKDKKPLEYTRNPVTVSR